MTHSGAAVLGLAIVVVPWPSAAQAKRRVLGRPQTEFSLTAGVAYPACGDCDKPLLGPAGGLEIFAPLGSWFRLGGGLDALYVGYKASGVSNRSTIAMAALVLRFEPVQPGSLDAFIDLGLGPATDGLGAFVGIGTEFYVSRGLRVGPYVRGIGVFGKATCSQLDSFGGGGCDPRVQGALSFGIGASWVRPTRPGAAR